MTPDIFTSNNEKKTKAPTASGGALSAFMVRPKGIHFETQEPLEEVLLLMRRHPITNVSWILSVIALLTVPFFLGPVFLGSGLLNTDMPVGYFLVLPLMWFLGTFGYAFAAFLHWYFNVYIVTNHRIVDIDWLNLLYRRHSSTQLEKIQDVTYKQGGILDSFFDFGTVLIQTAGTDPNFEFESVPQPNKVMSQLNELIEKKPS